VNIIETRIIDVIIHQFKTMVLIDIIAEIQFLVKVPELINL